MTAPRFPYEPCDWTSVDGYGCNHPRGHVGWHERHRRPGEPRPIGPAPCSRDDDPTQHPRTDAEISAAADQDRAAAQLAADTIAAALADTEPYEHQRGGWVARAMRGTLPPLAHGARAFSVR